jgi:2-polyprenyl-3-methyl-5-hydroxy-6-metoxy-1,4-benzoquinol methylase
MWDVIEHVPEPANVISAAAARLKSGGVFALSTGDLDSLCARLSGRCWHLFNLPEHLWFFTAKALRRMLSRAGLRVCSVRREIGWFPVAYLAERLSKSLRLPMAGVRRLAQSQWVVPLTLFDVVSVYAIKPG